MGCVHVVRWVGNCGHIRAEVLTTQRSRLCLVAYLISYSSAVNKIITSANILVQSDGRRLGGARFDPPLKAMLY